MLKYAVVYTAFVFLVVLSSSCIKSYSPPAVQAANNYLVVDGFINTAAGGTTTIVLSRSRSLGDTASFMAEKNAQVQVADSNGTVFPLTDLANTGTYSSQPLVLNLAGRYRVMITTSNGHQYQSAFVSPESTPAIDSVTWQQSPVDNSVAINVSSHDPLNNTRYYRWDFSETWQHNAPEITYWVLLNGIVTPLGANSLSDPNQIYQCWTTAPSRSIVVGTSLGLSQDVISLQPLTHIPLNDERLFVRYSILVSQYALTADAYNYWLLIQKNSQNLGSLFDVTPSQLNSNILPVSNPREPVIGYITASSMQQQRIFIANSQVPGWTTEETHPDCNAVAVYTDPNAPQVYQYPDTNYAPWYYTGITYPTLYVVKKQCIDCREYGGVTTMPSFW